MKNWRTRLGHSSSPVHVIMTAPVAMPRAAALSFLSMASLSQGLPGTARAWWRQGLERHRPLTIKLFLRERDRPLRHRFASIDACEQVPQYMSEGLKNDCSLTTYSNVTDGSQLTTVLRSGVMPLLMQEIWTHKLLIYLTFAYNAEWG